MQKHDRAYSASKFRRKYVGDIDMHYGITRNGIVISCCTTVNTFKTYLENANLFWKYASANNLCVKNRR